MTALVAIGVQVRNAPGIGSIRQALTGHADKGHRIGNRTVTPQHDRLTVRKDARIGQILLQLIAIWRRSIPFAEFGTVGEPVGRRF
ncbi:hypothetical protein [Paracoccus sp. Ld10]|uniref:hypothetical protein n=1 Tax=Paracoccus sp. Ld10 TaxID=649158 RepID=UPI00386DA565